MKKPKRKALWTTLPNVRSSKKPDKRALYLKLRRQFLKGKVCECCCQPDPLDVHHSRGRRGPLLTATQHWIALCRVCHRFVHDNPSWARAQGLLCKQGEWGKL